MSEIGLIVVDPGHFHAALVQKKMYPGVSPRVHVYAPLGPDLSDYLGRIARFNGRPLQPTRWELEVHADPDFLARMAREHPGAVAIFSGRNRGKIERMQRAVAAGLSVLADKPLIIRREDLGALEAVLGAARERQLVVCDMMTGRHEVVGNLLRLLHGDPELFGEQVAGTLGEPGVTMTSVHHLLKQVAGVPNPRPAWYFDITEQGEGLSDTGTHLVDRVQSTLFPGAAIDYRSDIRLHAASRWPTPVTAAQFRQVTGEPGWPSFLERWVKDGVLEYFCNGSIQYRLRGVHVALDIRWNWQADAGEDIHTACYRGSRARLEVRQGAAQGYRSELYVVAAADIAAALERRIAALQRSYPGLGLEKSRGEWRVVIPEELRVGHEANFAQLTRQFLGYVADPRSLPDTEAPNMLAKYYVCTEGAALSGG